jgi:hypothetical protein
MKAVALALLAALALSAQKVDVEFDKSAGFSTYRSFAIRDGRLNSKNPLLNSELIRKKLDGDIQKALEAKGLRFVGSGSSDLNVRYSLGSAQRRESEMVPTGPFGRARLRRVAYLEGTLVIDLRDSASKSLVWRSVAREQRKAAADIEGKLDDMVRKSIDKYPPKLK